MIAAVLALAGRVGGFLRANPRLFLLAAAVLVVLLSLAAARHSGVMAERHRWNARIERQRLEAETRAAGARVQAETEARAAAAVVADSVEKLDHADDATPDERPGPKSRAFDCERLRGQGTDVSKLALCR